MLGGNSPQHENKAGCREGKVAGFASAIFDMGYFVLFICSITLGFEAIDSMV